MQDENSAGHPNNSQTFVQFILFLDMKLVSYYYNNELISYFITKNYSKIGFPFQTQWLDWVKTWAGAF